jgi:hypothetical protein
MANENSGVTLVWGLAALAASIALALLGLSALVTAVAFAVPVVVQGTLAGVALAPAFATFAAAGVGTAGVAGGVAVVSVLVVRAVKVAEQRPFEVAVPLLAIANAMFMAVAYELLPESEGGAAAKILVSGLSPAGLVLGAVIFDKPGAWSKIAGAVLHVLLQAAAIAWIVASCLSNVAVRKETLAKLGPTALSLSLGALAAIAILPALIFLIWNERRKPPRTR